MITIINKVAFASVVAVCVYQQVLLTEYKDDVRVAEQAVISCLNGDAVAETENGMIISKGSFELKASKL